MKGRKELFFYNRNKLWRKDPVTEKQKEFIEQAREMSEYKLPRFEGKTKGEACDWIRKYGKLAVENNWAIENGY